MNTPARRHRVRVLAARAAASASTDEPVAGSVHELMLAQLHEHLRTLKGIQSVERKIEAKRQFLPLYADYLAGAMSAGQGGQDLVLSHLLVWHLDVGAWEAGLQLAAYALQHDLALPDRYERTLPTLLIDEVATAALKGQLVGDVALQVLGTVAVQTEGRDVPDQARAKLHKAIAYALLGKTPSTDPDLAQVNQQFAEAAMQHLKRAHELFAAVGVKKDMERLERRLKAEPGAD